MTSAADDTKSKGTDATVTAPRPEAKPSAPAIAPQPVAPGAGPQTAPASPVAPATAATHQAAAQPGPTTAPQPAPQAAPQAAAAASGATVQAPLTPPTVSANGRPRPSRFRRFVRSVFTHLLFAGIAVAGALGYLYHDPILRDVSSKVCADNVLGQWMTKPGTNLAGASKPSAGSSSTPGTTAPKVTTVEKTPAAAQSVPVTSPTPPLPPVPAASSTASATTAANPAATSSPVSAPLAPAPVGAAVPPKPAAGETKPPMPEVAVNVPAKPVPAAGAPVAAPSASAPPAPAVTPPAAAKVAAPAAVAVAPTADAKDNTSGSPDTAGAAGTQTLEQAWSAARKAFSEGKPEAVAAYRELAQRYSDNPDLTGELGNILFQQGKLDEAGDQFLETGKRLIARKQEARAACLAEVLAKFAPDKAADLAKQAGIACPITAKATR